MLLSTQIHTNKETVFSVEKSEGAQWLRLGDDGYSGASIFMRDEALLRLRDALDDHFADRNGVSLPCPVVMAGARAE